jgi:hypothetical protein
MAVTGNACHPQERRLRFDERQARSAGGRDGIFAMGRTFRPANEMMTKLFDRFLDKSGSGAEELAVAVGVPPPSCCRYGWCLTTCGCSGCWLTRTAPTG